MGIQWRYVKPLKETSLIEDFECAVTYEFPNSFKECVLNNNGGRPSASTFETNKTKEREIKSLLSFNKEDKENMECGVAVKNFNDIKVGDIIEAYEITEVKQKLA